MPGLQQTGFAGKLAPSWSVSQRLFLVDVSILVGFIGWVIIRYADELSAPGRTRVVLHGFFPLVPDYPGQRSVLVLTNT